MVIVCCMCVLGMCVCFNVHVYDEYFYVSVHMCLVSVYVKLMCVHSVFIYYTHIFMPNICVCLCTVCILHVQYECMYACGWLCRCCMAYECLMCIHICM